MICKTIPKAAGEKLILPAANERSAITKKEILRRVSVSIFRIIK